VSSEEPGQVRCTPTDPSIEFDVFEVMRVRLVEALTASGHELIEAERVALYVVGAARPVSKLLKLTTRSQPAAHEEVREVLARLLDEVPALEKARRIMLRLEEGAEGDADQVMK
jgi:uncharacterized protein (DUF2236 family)